MEENYTFEPLRFSDDYLEPILSSSTIRYHYYGHYKNYINTLNKLIEGNPAFSKMNLPNIIKHSGGQLYNIAAQVWNHKFYFDQFTDPHTRSVLPIFELGKIIDRDFGSFDEFRKKFKEVGLSVFGSGWVWLVFEYDAFETEDKLVIKATKNADIPSGNLLMTLDLWEHAYYLDYPNNRADYIDNFFNILDWDVVENRYKTRVKFR